MKMMNNMPTPEEVAVEHSQAVLPEDGAKDGFQVLTERIGREEVLKASQILQKYKEGKANLEKRIVENEQWYKLRHWECMRKSSKQEVEPTSAWLFNCIANKHADAMDNFPSPNVLAREPGDRQQAKILSSIIPVILDQCEFEEVYSDAWDAKLIGGTGVYGVFWDKDKHNGLGDITINRADILNLFWQPGITDIQQSRHLFYVTLEDNEVLIERYPQLEGKLSSATVNVAQYIYDDTVNTQEKSAVIDWYYKKNVEGVAVVHYCKYVNDVVLYATENDGELASRGIYDHGLYPYVFDPLFNVQGTPAGFGYVDVGKSAQEYIDRGNQAIMKNMLANARPRYFVNTAGSVNEAEYADFSNDFIHVDGNLGKDSIYPVSPNTLNNVYVQLVNNKIEELKEVTGNRDVSTGGTGGVTAASAIAAMQEAGSKLSRDNSKAAYRAYRKVVLMVIELIRQFYDLPRKFRIVGENGAQEFVSYTNSGIVPQRQGMMFGNDMGMRTPLFDIEITAQKASPYSKMSQNELAMQLYGAGIFDPARSDMALAVLDMMDFDRKDFVMQKVAQNGGMYQQLMMMMQRVQMLEQSMGIAPSMPMGGGTPAPAAPATLPEKKMEGEESSITKKARQRVAESTSPV